MAQKLTMRLPLQRDGRWPDCIHIPRVFFAQDQAWRRVCGRALIAHLITFGVAGLLTTLTKIPAINVHFYGFLTIYIILFLSANVVTMIGVRRYFGIGVFDTWISRTFENGNQISKEAANKIKIRKGRYILLMRAFDNVTGVSFLLILVHLLIPFLIVGIFSAFVRLL